MRYLEWWYDPDPTDSTTVTDFAYILREEDGTVHVEFDRHETGLFAKADWLRLIEDVGFEPHVVRDNYDRDVFVGRRPE